ncbi:MAG TPA: hypothetical protein VMF13_13585, partial [Luteitalea sp.]|nr:hypothetical protein [Luteitalea sp.]
MASEYESSGQHEPAPQTAAATLKEIWRRRYWLGAGALAAAIVAAVPALMSARQYAATTTLLAFAGQVPASGDSSGDAGATLLPIITNQAMVSDVVREFALTSAPNSLSPGTFRQRAMEVQLQPGSDVVSVTVRLSTPDLAARVANALADRAVA